MSEVTELSELFCLPDAFVIHLGAKHLLLIQTYGAKGTEIPLSIWTCDWTQVLSFTCSTNRRITLLPNNNTHFRD